MSISEINKAQMTQNLIYEKSRTTAGLMSDCNFFSNISILIEKNHFFTA
jgi:hypothetical protein